MVIDSRYTALADQYLQNSQEFNRLWEELNSLLRGAESVISRSMNGASGESRGGYGIQLLEKVLSIEVECDHRVDRFQIVFRLHDFPCRKKEDYTLRTLRLVHEHRGAIVFLAEEFCKRYNRQHAFKDELRRLDLYI